MNELPAMDKLTGWRHGVIGVYRVFSVQASYPLLWSNWVNRRHRCSILRHFGVAMGMADQWAREHFQVNRLGCTWLCDNVERATFGVNLAFSRTATHSQMLGPELGKFLLRPRR